MSCKRCGKETKIQEFMYRDTSNVEYEMCDYNGNKLSHESSNKRLKEKSGNDTRKTFNRFTTNDGYAWNITHNMENITV
jgi:hypothetical protein